jgi:hypothetical protein
MKPKNVPKANPITVATLARIKVLPTARETSLATERPVAIDVPRLPCRTCQNHSAYCTGSGLSKPYSARIWSIRSWVASAGRIAESGSPGAMWTRRKQMILTPITTGVT